MIGQCMRQGCARTAEARLIITPGELLVTLEDLTDPDEPTQMVCNSHANSIRPPVGWSVSDRRKGHSQSWKAASPGDTGSPGDSGSPGETAATGKSVATGSPGEILAEPPVESAARSVEPTEEIADAGFNLHDGAEIDVEGDPEPDPGREKPNASGLLGRAFEWTGPQRSVLTQDSDQPTDD